MTITETPTPGPATAIEALVGETLVSLLPESGAWSIRTGPDGARLPEANLEAMGGQVGDHVVAVVVTAELGQRLLLGPPAAADLVAALSPAVAAIGEVLAVGAPGEIVAMDPASVEAERTPHTLTCSVHDGDQHVATVLVTPPAPAPDEGPDAVSFQPVVGTSVAAAAGNLDVLHDVEMGVTVELGRARMPLRDILSVVPGSVIELDRPASAPVDVLVNGTLIARGEVVVIDEEFGIRITEVIGHEQKPHGTSAP